MSLADYDFGEDEPWRIKAMCRGADSDIFFDEEREAEAKTICGKCSVKKECGEWAIQTRMQAGVFGGMTEADRSREMRRRRFANRNRLAGIR